MQEKSRAFKQIVLLKNQHLRAQKQMGGFFLAMQDPHSALPASNSRVRQYSPGAKARGEGGRNMCQLPGALNFKGSRATLQAFPT